MKKSAKIKLWAFLMRLGNRSGCHQREDRSFQIQGWQFPICSRCTGILLGQIIGLVLYACTIRILIFIDLSFLAIMFLDWYIQYKGIKESTNLRRFITGSLAGIAQTSILIEIIIFIIHGGENMALSVGLIILGFALLIKGADFLVDGSSNIAKKFHIPEIIIGLTIVSIGTSMPELFVSVTSALEGYSDMAIGNVIGSNICNLLLILGLSTVIKPVKFQRETRLIEIPVCLAITIIFMIFCNTGARITTEESVILILLFVIFIIYTVFMGIKGETFDNKDMDNKNVVESNISIIRNIIYIVLGVIGLKIGGDLSVNNAVTIAKHFNISEQIISLTILAIGTSLPELVTSVTAAIKGNSDIAIGNIIGSNIFNMLLIIGVASLINPISYSTSYNIEMIILILGTILLSLFPIIPPKNEMNRGNGVIYLITYVAYMIILFNV